MIPNDQRVPCEICGKVVNKWTTIGQGKYLAKICQSEACLRLATRRLCDDRGEDEDLDRLVREARPDPMNP